MFEHGPLCWRGGGNRAGSDDLRHGDGKPDRSVQDSFRGSLHRLGTGLLGHGGRQALMALVMARHRAAKGTVHDSAAAAAAHTHTLPTSATLVVAPMVPEK